MNKLNSLNFSLNEKDLSFLYLCRKDLIGEQIWHIEEQVKKGFPNFKTLDFFKS